MTGVAFAETAPSGEAGNPAPGSARELPIAVVAPTGRDGEMMQRVLSEAGFDARALREMAPVLDLVRNGQVGVIILAEEALTSKARGPFSEALGAQPSWSDVPIVLLNWHETLSGPLRAPLREVAELGNVTLLERPVRVATLLTVVRSGMRARQRQLDVKAHLEERAKAEVTLRESESRLRAAVRAAPNPLMLHAGDGEVLQLSDQWMELCGYCSGEFATIDEWARRALTHDEAGLTDVFGPGSEQLEGHIGERKVLTADGDERIWDFHRVSLGRLPDGRKVSLTAAVDVTEYRELVESERSARKQAEEANAAKSQFLANMSHELRTPLNAISGYTQLMALGLHGPVTEEQRQDLERIDRSQRHLLSLINDILNFAKIEAGHLEVETTAFEVAELLDTLTTLVEPQLREKKLELTQRNESPGVQVSADPDKVRQILVNLMSNAIKFTPDGGHIRLTCFADDGRVNIEVADDGQGIPEDKLEVIFEPFVQVGRDFNAPTGGTGLGLSISRDLARRMGGDLTVTSTPQKGSSFVLSLPRA